MRLKNRGLPAEKGRDHEGLENLALNILSAMLRTFKERLPVHQGQLEAMDSITASEKRRIRFISHLVANDMIGRLYPAVMRPKFKI